MPPNKRDSCEATLHDEHAIEHASIEQRVAGVRKTMLFALVLFACSTVHAAEWVLVGISAGSGAKTFVDRSSIKIAGNVRHAWVKRSFGHHAKKDPLNQKWWADSVGLYGFNCADSSARLESLVVYFDDGTAEPNNGPYPDRWEPAVPESLEFAETRFVCTGENSLLDSVP